MLKQEFVEKEGIVSISRTEVSGTAYNCSTCTAMFTDPNAFMDHITNGHIGWNDIQFCMFLSVKCWNIYERYTIHSAWTWEI